MNDRVLLVDLENVQTVNVGKVTDDAEVKVFYGPTQKTPPEELVVQAQLFGTRLQWIKIAGQGRDALDFHIAYYLGNTLADRQQAHRAVTAPPVAVTRDLRSAYSRVSQLQRQMLVTNNAILREGPCETHAPALFGRR